MSMPLVESSSWVPLLFLFHCYYHALPNIGWYFPLAQVMDPQFEFEYNPAWNYWKVLAHIYRTFARGMGYRPETVETFQGDSVHAIQFYNFLLCWTRNYKLKAAN